MKTVAIIGNSHHLLGSRLGDKINSHDVVIRLNSYKLYPYQADVGTKTDTIVLVQNADNNMLARKGLLPEELQTCNELWFSRPLGDRGDMDNDMRVILKAIGRFKVKDCRFPDSKGVKELRAKLNSPYYPSTGIVTIFMVLETYPDADIRIAGFGDPQETAFKEGHYYPNVHGFKWIHDGLGERALIDHLVDEGKISWLTS